MSCIPGVMPVAYLRTVLPLLARHEGDYLQTSHYAWEDGRRERRELPGRYRDGRVWFDNELTSGWADEERLDEHHRTLLMHWLRKGDPGLYLYEMIQLSDRGQHRTRVWQWLRQGRCIMRTMIDEQQVTDHEREA